MKLNKQKAFVLYNMDKPDPYNETMTFNNKKGAIKAQRFYGGSLKETFIHSCEKEIV